MAQLLELAPSLGVVEFLDSDGAYRALLTRNHKGQYYLRFYNHTPIIEVKKFKLPKSSIRLATVAEMYGTTIDAVAQEVSHAGGVVNGRGRNQWVPQADALKYARKGVFDKVRR